MEPRHHFDVELKDLYQMILRMGALVEEALRKSVVAMETHDLVLARSVIDGDKAIDAMHMQIENESTHVIAMEQPVAHDLRELITVTKLAANLERIGDHARHIAKNVEPLPPQVVSPFLPRIKEMADVGITMVHDALTAFVEQDEDVARDVAERDDQIDRIHKELYRELVTMMQKKPEWVDHGVSMMFLNRFLERLGDHVTDMCQWVIFSKSGRYVELNT